MKIIHGSKIQRLIGGSPDYQPWFCFPCLREPDPRWLHRPVKEYGDIKNTGNLTNIAKDTIDCSWV
ncbi:hypothetical protein [Nitrosospira multiformis]|uniref:hypothetical protein n=1 Tax=Nitrosospira multiformis TaxID=1231 RepID=UPI00089A58E3|nr:hypothetical protein [Nitrosospira multiformis]SDZ85386.1 hypothetical protein SAMN05216411_102135 [Nitrosospira multiformis]